MNFLELDSQLPAEDCDKGMKLQVISGMRKRGQC